MLKPPFQPSAHTTPQFPHRVIALRNVEAKAIDVPPHLAFSDSEIAANPIGCLNWRRIAESLTLRDGTQVDSNTISLVLIQPVTASIFDALFSVPVYAHDFDPDLPARRLASSLERWSKQERHYGQH